MINGERFCNDDCYEEYDMENEEAEEDACHPYMSDYEDIRSEYIRFLEWEKYGLDFHINENKLHQLMDFIDTISSVQYDYLTYYLAEGDGWNFCLGNLPVLPKMEEIKERVRKWKPYRDYEYPMTFKLDSDEAFMENWWRLSEYLRAQGWKKLYKLLRDRVYSEEDMVFRFYDKDQLDEAIHQIRKKFKDYDIQYHVDIIDYCDGG